MTAGVRMQFVSPPNWPQAPAGWTPPPGWEPPADWSPAPDGWQFWQPQTGPTPDAIRPAWATLPPTDGFAIAALVTGFLGGALLSLIFGFVALARIRKGGRTGRSLVFIGWAVSAAWILAIVVTVIVKSGQ